MKDSSSLWTVFNRRVRHAASKSNFRYNNVDNVDDWLAYMKSYNSVFDKEFSFRNASDFELDIDINDELDNFEMNSSTVKPIASGGAQDLVELYKIVVPVLLAACCLSFLFNITMVCSVRCLRRKLSPTICLSLSLAMADAYASLVIGLGLFVNSLLPIVYGVQLGPMSFCFILSLEAFRLGGLVVAVLHLLALAINHYIGILRPLHYAHIVTRETTVCGIITMWIVPVVFFLIYFSSIPNDGFQSHRCSSYDFLLYSPFRITTSVLFFCPLILMTLMYSHMFIVVRQHQKGLLQCPSSRQLHKNVKAIITTLFILGTYLLGWMPAVLFFVLTCLDCTVPFTTIPLKTRVPVGIFINTMIVAKSFVDPVIYVVRMPEIKCALKAIWITRCGHLGEYSTPSHSRTDTKRLTLLTSRRKSRMSARNGSPNSKIDTPVAAKKILETCITNGIVKEVRAQECI
ncbi:g_PROTEIN_RECEP_F1_2 domain-containing protein [Trichonephila inaurata madagascariensis]|uniref:G_PROTEIN_RECEP_F1_2 domain-containing protein n=2 Tax=Trichonephila inaurata madagascariensis TaxID=2747483 RepID=A0A8X6I7D6_9ARAC|nr:g_PROTEIN_RECEP_F1_2 domain-containing protein [Trichonephila inaurata madagascariensis]